MKVLSLKLAAFGPFTDVVIDLSAGREGLHIVYGPNEAGKSTALRALRQLLYGIPERSADGFRHPYPRLRIGGVLRSAGGSVLAVVRRKGRGGTLRAADDKTAVAESELQGLLNGVDAGFFATMFGIGYEDLVAGGQEILRGGGDLGRLIFAAGSGAANVSAVVEGLRAEADELFRPSGQKQAINAAVSRLRQCRSDLKAAQLPGQEWERHDQALKEAERRKQAVEEKMEAARRRLSRLQRIAEAHPLIGRRRETQKSMEAVVDAVLLPEGFAERRADALLRLGIAETERAQASESLSALQESMSELPEHATVLERSAEIEEIHQELGSQRKAARDRVSIETRRNTLRTEARQALRGLSAELRIEEAERLRIRRPEAVRIQELGAEYERIETRIEETRRKIPDHARLIAASAERIESLARPRPVGDLGSALAVAEEALPLEKQLTAAAADARELVQACGQAAARLGLLENASEALARLPVPAAETVRIFEERFDRLERRLNELAEEERRAGAALSEASGRLEAARLEREVPTEEDLREARELRARYWRQVACRLEGGTPPEDGEGPDEEAVSGPAGLATAFEASMARADEIADRLRREADRVAEKARLIAERRAQQGILDQLAGQMAAARAGHAAALSEWSAVWRSLGVPARSPREMRQWLTDFRGLAEKAAESLKRRAQTDALTAEVSAAREALSRGLAALGEPAAAPGETLASLHRRARQMAAAEEELARRRDDLVREKTRLAGELETMTAQLQAHAEESRRWQEQWKQAVKPLGLEAAARPAEANAVMEELKSLFDRLQRAEAEQKRMDGIDRDAQTFRHKVEALAAALAPELEGRPAEEAALELQRRLIRAREAQSKRQALDNQAEQAQATIRKSAESIAAIESLLRSMCAEAGCGRPAELPEAERRSGLRRRIETDLREIDARLLQLGGGADVADFIAEASAVDPDGVAGGMEQLKEEIGRLTLEKSELDQRIGSERSELGRMDGGDRAARIAEEIQALLGRLEGDVERYARLRIAGRVLALAMERFREKSQGPILKKASGLFGRITCGSFEGLRADHDADGHPVLVGVRRGSGETVAVEGMSDGTADQLYLALRLAGLEHYMDANEPMPFIVDDILVKFDNERAAATLQALADLARRTQVVFFTHHRHLVELAHRTLPAAAVFEHVLDHQRPLKS